jgi:hypothetical protein
VVHSLLAHTPFYLKGFIVNQSRLLASVLAVSFAALSVSASVPAFAQAPAPAAPAAAPAASATSMGPMAAEVGVMNATVEAVDLKNRIVTLRDNNGNLATMNVAKTINNLEKVKKGDIFVVEFAQAIAIGLTIAPKGAQPGVVGKRTITMASKNAAKPFTEITDVFVATAKIDSIDAAQRTAVLVLPSGEKQKINIDKKVLGLEKFKVGDDVVVEYADDMAIGFVTPSKK